MAERKIEKTKSPVKFPMNILKPIGEFLAREVKRLEARKKSLAEVDPFKDTSRVTDNASPDTDAAEQFGHQKIAALQAQIDRHLIQIKKALARIKIGKYGICEVCGKMINTDRLMVMPETTLCAECSKKKEE
ncbi:MAG: TraR/DksA family transcriptional regulator [Microgenomates group bacterium]